MIWLFESIRPRRRWLAPLAILAAATLPQAPAAALAQVPERPTPGSMVTPAEPLEDPRSEPAALPAPDDEAVIPAGAADETNPLPGAKVKSGAAPAPADGGGISEGDRFALPMDRLSTGRQDFKLSIEVQQPGPVINLGREMTVNLLVKNTGNVEAVGVSVIYQLPDGLELVSSVPAGDQEPGNKSNYYFKKPSLAVGTDWTIAVKVKANKVTVCDHAATVTAKAGARASLIVQEPKLKVEQAVDSARPLIGRAANFRISVSNPGTGPARNVVVQANLSDGLRSVDGDKSVEQVIPVIKPGERFDLDTLVVDTKAGGQQTCTVLVSSPDVTPVPEDARCVKAIEVISPKLVVKLEAHEHRYTDQKNDYKLTVANSGTAPMENVKVVATMPTTGGRLTNIGDNLGVFDRQGRKILWTIPRLDPDTNREFTFTYQTGGVGLYTTLVEATSGELRQTARVATDVKGLAVVVVKMGSSNPVIDVGDTTVFDLQIRNVGTQAASKILLSGMLSTNLVIEGISGLDKEIQFNTKDGRFTFPEIDRLEPGATLAISIEAKAVGRGSGTCRLQLDHADLPHGEKPSEDDLIHAIAHTTITGESPPRVSSARP